MRIDFAVGLRKDHDTGPAKRKKIQQPVRLGDLEGSRGRGEGRDILKSEAL